MVAVHMKYVHESQHDSYEMQVAHQPSSVATLAEHLMQKLVLCNFRINFETKSTFCGFAIPQRLGIEDGLELKIVRRGAAPLGGGDVALRVPIVRQLNAINLVDEGMVKRIRGVAYSMKVSHSCDVVRY